MSRTGGNTGWVTYYGRDGKIFVAYCHTCSDQDPATVSRDRESDWTLEADGDVWFFKRGEVMGVLALLQGQTMDEALLMSSCSSMGCSGSFWAGNYPHAVCHLVRCERPGAT